MWLSGPVKHTSLIDGAPLLLLNPPLATVGKVKGKTAEQLCHSQLERRGQAGRLRDVMAIPPEPSAVHNDAPPTDRQPSYKLSHSLSGHTRSVTALRFSNDGKFLVSAGADGYVHIWDATTGSHIREIRCHHRGINDLSLSPDSLYLATCSDDSTCSIHLLSPSSSSNSSPATNTPLRVLEAHTAPVLACSFSPKSSLLVSGSFDESAMIWDIRKGKVLRRLPAHAEAVWTVGWDWEGGMVVTGSSDGLIRLWDANTGQCLKTLDNESNSPVSYAAFTPSSFFLLSSTLSSTIRLSNFHTAKVLKTLRAPGIYVNEKYPCHAVVYQALPRGTEAIETSDRGRRKKKLEAWVMTGSENGKLLVWDLQSRTVLQVLEGGHENAVTAVAVHPNGKTIASGSLEPEKLINIWRDTSEERMNTSHTDTVIQPE